jgi:hypothetical protein
MLFLSCLVKGSDLIDQAIQVGCSLEDTGRLKDFFDLVEQCKAAHSSEYLDLLLAEPSYYLALRNSPYAFQCSRIPMGFTDKSSAFFHTNLISDQRHLYHRRILFA